MPIILPHNLTPSQRAAIIAHTGPHPADWYLCRVFSFSRSGRLLDVINLTPDRKTLAAGKDD